MSKSFGIDLGTSFICAGTFDTNTSGIRIIENFSVRKHLNYVSI